MKSVREGHPLPTTPATASPRTPLPTPDDPRLARALEEYQAALEAGIRLNRHELLARYPDIAEKLAECLEGLEFVNTVAPQLQEPALPPETVAGVRPEQLLGDYRILREVGRGGMGVVYEAEQQSLGRRVALKVLHGPAAQDPRLLSRFQRESRAAAQLHHTNIVPVFEVGQHNGSCYYAMQFIRGQALDEVFRELQRLRANTASDATLLMTRPPETTAAALPDRSELSSVTSNYQRYCRNVARLGLQVAEALAYAHGRGIIHRDIKPANLLLDTTGVLWVSDFGLVKTQDPALTDTGDLVGTLRYMAPERFRGECDARADVYALGLTLYELLVLRPAFDGQDRLHLVDQISHQEPARPRSIDPRIPRDLETILMKAIEKDPRRRYSSAEALADDLRRFLADEPIQARRIGPLERLGRWGRRNPLVAGLSAAIVLVTALGFAGVLGQWQVALAHERQARENATQAQKNEQQANQQRDEARALAEKLQTALEQLQRTTYTAHMNLARHAWDAGATDQMVELLEQHRPKPGETDLRHFEWYYLYRLCHGELFTLKHAGGARVAYSPDGKRLATGSGGLSPNWAGEVKVWDAQTRQELLTLKGHTGWIWSLAFSPDGKRLASGSGGGLDHQQQKGFPGEVKVWDAQTGQELFTIQGRSQLFPALAFSPDGKRLAVAGGPSWEQGEVAVWDAQTGKELLTLKGHTGYVASVAFSPDGKRLASAAMDDTVRVWDAQTGQELLSFKDWSYSVAFSPDGKRLATSGDNRTRAVRVWDAQTGQELLTCKGHARTVNSVAFSPDGKRLASGSVDRAVKVWDAQTGQEILTLKGHTAPVNSVAFSPDGKHLASGSDDETVKIWDATTSPEDRAVRRPTGDFTGVAYSPDGKRLATLARDNSLKVWDAQTGQELLSLQGQTGTKDWRSPVVAYSPDGKRLASSSGQEIKVWDAQTGKELLTFTGHNARVWSVAFSPDGKRLASASAGNAVKVWDVQTGKELLTLSLNTLVNKSGLTSVAFSPDGKRLATLSPDYMVKVWESQTGQELFTFKGHTGPVTSVAFSPDSKRLVSGGHKGSVKVWEAQTGQEVLSLRGHTYDVIGVAYSPDGKRLATRSADNTVKVWDAQTGQELLSLKGLSPQREGGMRGGSGAVVFSPDGHRLAVAGVSGLEIWDATPLPAKP